MWLWRKQSPFGSLNLPKKVFISHSYRDARARKRLLKLLPKDVQPFIFPPITVPPEEMVSDTLIQAVLACNGLIYLQGGISDQSFWVAFERDYARRAGKSIFAFDPHSSTLTPDTTAPLDLPVFISHSHGDDADVVPILQFMERERHFDTLFDDAVDYPGFEIFTSGMRPRMLGQLARGGYMVLFWSLKSSLYLGSNPASRTWIGADMEMIAPQYPTRILVALLDPIDVPPFLQSAPIVQLFGDQQRSRQQRIDDLIVRLYWLIYRNTRQNQLS